MASELSSSDIFELWPGWEVIRAEVNWLEGKATKQGDVVSVGGQVYCRPQGNWENVRLPFLHTWLLRDGSVLSMESFLDGGELSRVTERKSPETSRRLQPRWKNHRPQALAPNPSTAK
jgi:hypothetical protein